MASQEYSPEDDFINNASSECRLCKNFGTASCPAFKAAQEITDLDADKLLSNIAMDQLDQDLNDCSNG